MQLYSKRPGVAVLQVVADLAAIATIVASVWISGAVRAAIVSLSEVGERLEDAGEGVAGTLRELGAGLGQLPLVGDGVAARVDEAAVDVGQLSAAGLALQQSATSIADAVALALWLLPCLLLVIVWLVPRLRSAVQPQGNAPSDGTL